MKTTLAIICLIAATAICFCGSSALLADFANQVGERQNQPEMTPKKPKILIAYFSHYGHTRALAKQIHENVKGDLVEIKTAAPYPVEYDATLSQARREQDNNYRPPLAAKVENMDTYELVFLGYPNWWGTMPMAIFTFLESYDWSGKTIVPFCTYDGSRLGRSERDLAKYAPKATLLKGLAIDGTQVGNAGEDVRQWLSKLGMLE